MTCGCNSKGSWSIFVTCNYVATRPKNVMPIFIYMILPYIMVAYIVLSKSSIFYVLQFIVLLIYQSIKELQDSTKTEALLFSNVLVG